MAGILANSVSATMVSGDTAADKAVSGYLTAEQITLSTTPTGSTYAWGIAKPSGATARSDLTALTGASVLFTPDAAGYYTVTCIVDSTTTYVIRISTTQVAAVTSLEAFRLSPKADANIPTPPLGAALFYSSDRAALTAKDSAGVAKVVESLSMTPTGTADSTGEEGEIAYDNTYLYVKTSAGWKRLTLASF